jgi:uncharacterized protein (DUF2141 family)
MFKLYVTTFLILLSPVLLSAQSNRTKKNVGKIIFATQPFSNGNVSTAKSFTSSDFIYGQLVPNGGKIFNELFDAPGGNKDSTYDKWHLYYNVKVFKNGVIMGNEYSRDYSNKAWPLLNINWNIKTLNVDVLPGPENVSTGIDPMLGYATDPNPVPLYNLIDPVYFPENGKYTIKVEIFDESMDAWGKKNTEEKWPSFQGEFEFTFSSSDIAKLKANRLAVIPKLAGYYKKALNEQRLKVYADNAKAKAADDKAKVEAMEMPASWTAKSQPIGGGFTVDQIKKFFLNETKGKSIVKVVADINGGWVVQKDKYGIPTHQYLNQPVVVFFKNINGQCGLHHISIAQSYIGKGKYNKPGLDLYDEELLPCSKMK